jgi:hypothetical protein
MSRDERMYLQDIASSCAKVLQYTKNMTQADLIRDQKCYDAVVRNLEIIGEAAKPEGRKTIAHRFNGGYQRPKKKTSPVRDERTPLAWNSVSFAPPGLGRDGAPIPTVETVG